MDIEGEELFGKLVSMGLGRVVNYPKGLIIQCHEAEDIIRRHVLALSREEAKLALIAAVTKEVHKRAQKSRL